MGGREGRKEIGRRGREGGRDEGLPSITQPLPLSELLGKIGEGSFLLSGGGAAKVQLKRPPDCVCVSVAIAVQVVHL